MDRPQPFFAGLRSALSPRKYMFCAWFYMCHIKIISAFYDESTEFTCVPFYWNGLTLIPA